MSTLRKLVFGDTWILPLGVLLTVGGATAMRAVAPGTWEAVGPVLLPLAVLVVLALAVRASLPPRR